MYDVRRDVYYIKIVQIYHVIHEDKMQMSYIELKSIDLAFCFLLII